MKKIILLTILLAASFTGGFANNISIINGTWLRKGAKEVKLFKVESGTIKEMASSQLDSNNKFLFAFNISNDGFYVIGNSAKTASDNYTFYFKPGDQLNVEVGEKSYKLIGENTPENREMEKWHEFILPIERKSLYFVSEHSTYVDFFPLLDEKLEVMNNYKVEYTANSTFNELFKDYRKYDMLLNALMFTTTPRSAHPQDEDFPDYYHQIDISDITSGQTLLKYPYGMTLITSYNLMAPRILADKYTEEQIKDLKNVKKALDVVLPEIKNDEVQGELILMYSQYLRTYEEFLDFEQKYGKHLITDNQKERLNDKIKDVAKLAQGQMAVDFKFPDADNKEIALSDFKGKVVYIDVWATWCAPCIKEIPSLKKLEEEYHGKDIVFMSVSTDESKDIQKWKDFIQKRELKGIQLFAGDRAKKELMEIYKISGIPRFILVGKDGKLISADALRPSSTDIRAQLDSALAK